MSIQINKAECIGCGKCAKACPGNLIYISDARKAAIRDVRDCWGCTSCMKECPVAAISYFLGADIGGDGTRLKIRSGKDEYDWEFIRPDQTVTTIKINRKNANQY